MNRNLLVVCFLLVSLASWAGGPQIPLYVAGGTTGGTTDTATITTALNAAAASDALRLAAIASAARTDMANTFAATQTFDAIGVGTNTPAVPFHNEGFSMLGELSPHIKCKILTGTTPSADASQTQVLHGLATSAVILGYTAHVEYGADGSGKRIPMNLNDSGYQFRCYISDSDGGATAFTVFMDAGSQILSKRFTILVWYADATPW